MLYHRRGGIQRQNSKGAGHNEDLVSGDAVDHQAGDHHQEQAKGQRGL